MTSKTHALLQLIATAIQTANIADLTGYISFLPAKYAAVILFLITTAQGGLGLYNHYFNPDGTSAFTAYKP